MLEYIESLIWFGSTRSNLLTFLNQSQSTCGWTINQSINQSIFRVA